MATESNEAVGEGLADAVGVAAHEAGSAPGMPQLDFAHWGNQIFWLLVTLVVIYLVLSRIALPRIAAVLSERQGTITNDIAAAEDLKAKAVEAEESYNKAFADARSEANTIVADARAEMPADLDKARDFLRGFGGPGRKAANLGCDHGKAAACFARAGGLDPGIQRQKVGLECDTFNHRNNLGNRI